MQVLGALLDEGREKRLPQAGDRERKGEAPFVGKLDILCLGDQGSAGH